MNGKEEGKSCWQSQTWIVVEGTETMELNYITDIKGTTSSLAEQFDFEIAP